MPQTAPKFGRYVVLDELAGDAGERTLVAFDPQLDRKVGLKVFPIASEPAQARRRDRAKILAGIVHSNVVCLHDIGTFEGRQFAAMDFVEGNTIEPWIERARPSWRRVLDVYLAAGDGLVAAHEAGLVHGRFGPRAVVVGDDGQIRVIDFVRSTLDIGPAAHVSDDRKAWVDAVFGTLWEGESGPRPSSPRLDRKVRRIIEEARDGSGRFDSLSALLDEIHRACATPRQVRGAVALLALVAGPAVWWATSSKPAPEVQPWCEGVDARLEQTWNADVAARGREAFTATGVPFADTAWDTVEPTLDRFVAEWHETQTELCQPDPTDPSGASHAAAQVCLHRHFQSLRAFINALETADPELVASAAHTASTLGSPKQCAAGDDLQYDEADLEQVLAIESQLSQAAVQRGLGRYPESLDSGRDALARANNLGHRALIARAEHTLALTNARYGREEEAERGYHEAFSAALASGLHEIVARSALDLVSLMAEQGRHDDADRWIEHARAALEHTDWPRLQTRLTVVQGLAAYRRGDNEAAKGHFERAIEMADADEPPDVFAKMQASQNLSNALGRLGEFQAEIDLLEKSMEVVEAELGSEHPTMADHLNSMGVALSHRGSPKLGLESQRKAHAIFDATFGPDHAKTIAAQTALASTLHEVGDDETASETYTKALAAAKRTFEPKDPRYVNVLGNVGMFYALTDDLDRAAELLAKAAKANEAIHGPEHLHTLGHMTNLAATYMFAERYDEAAEIYGTLVERTENALGAKHPQMVPVLLGLARVEILREKPGTAVAPLERALSLSKERNVEPIRIAAVQVQLANALWDADVDRPRARSLAQDARQSYLAASDGGSKTEEHIAGVDQWLAEHTL